jgi:flagellar protein FliS
MNMLAQQKYKQLSIETASPAELTLMLYKGAIRFINQAKIAIENKNTTEAHEYCLRAQDIVMELMAGLDMRVPLAKNLMTMYDFLLYRLKEANIKKSVEILNETKGFFEEFVDTWTEAMKIAKKK